MCVWTTAITSDSQKGHQIYISSHAKILFLTLQPKTGLTGNDDQIYLNADMRLVYWRSSTGNITSCAYIPEMKIGALFYCNNI